MWCKLLLLSLVLSVSLAEDAKPEHVVNDRSDYKRSLSKNCDQSYSVTCLKLDVVSWVDKLNENEHYSVFPGITLVREAGSARSNTADIVADLARDFPNDPEARLDAFLLKKVQDYLSNHALKLNLYDADGAAQAVATARKEGGGFGGGGGGGKKGGGGMGVLLAAAAMMKGTLMTLALGGLAALAGKALMTGLISLLLSAIIGLKSLTHGGGKTTYEVVSKPIYTHSASHSASHEDYHHGGHSGYGRSFDTPLPLGLRPEYKPT